MNLANRLSNWAVEVQDISELEEDFNHLLVDKFRGKNPYSILLSTDTLMTFALDQLYLFNKVKDEVFIKTFYYHKINLIEIDLFSNDSKLMIFSDKNEKISINPANELLFFRGIEKIRLSSCEAINDEKLDKIAYLKTLDTKLYNYAMFSLLKCDKILETIYESNNKKNGSNVTILSTNEIIFIRESSGDNKPTESVLGGQWVFIPLSRIQSFERITEKNHSQLKIKFENHQYYTIQYDNPSTNFEVFDEQLTKEIDA